MRLFDADQREALLLLLEQPDPPDLPKRTSIAICEVDARKARQFLRMCHRVFFALRRMEQMV